jgi:outer membrane protein OmpA-like peptidoglycan-associated protein
MMKTFSAIALILISQLAFAQAPTAEQMIEQLKVKPEAVTAPAPGARTRSLRNLTVEAAAPSQAATEPPASTERPSLSLLIQFDFNSATIRAESQQALTLSLIHI